VVDISSSDTKEAMEFLSLGSIQVTREQGPRSGSSMSQRTHDGAVSPLRPQHRKSVDEELPCRKSKQVKNTMPGGGAATSSLPHGSFFGCGF
jgi:hypothetical protein